MATTHLTSREKWHVYHTLAQINRAFYALHFHLRNLEQSKPFHTQRIREYQGFSRELQRRSMMSFWKTCPNWSIRTLSGMAGSKLRGRNISRASKR